MTILDLRHIVMEYQSHARGLRRQTAALRAVDDVDLTIGASETVGLVGESGSGKSTLGKIAMRLLRPTSGEVLFLDKPIHNLPEASLRPLRAEMGIVFQDPYASLNPRQRLEVILSLPFRIHRRLSGAQLRRQGLDLLDRVGLRPADGFAPKFPHQLSGGQRQRVAIARAIALRPKLVVADEPISSLDVSVGAQILDLLRELQRELGVSYLFISHDLGVVHAMSQRVAVMYRGQIVEEGPSSQVLLRAAHPYTQLLVASIPELLEAHAGGDVPPKRPVTRTAPGCHFQARCPYARPRCTSEAPGLETTAEAAGGHRVRCFLMTDPAPPDGWGVAREYLARRRAGRVPSQPNVATGIPSH